ncbi:amidohydrolase family protein [Pseudomonas sp. PA27(2017)]|uniref:amidohydrolase family protein n=1 Tax=Pseudomonas sp. PA27(2017) TaxID=1932112 RepID=UPI000962586A|nr:amidohydrolase family protein [Pseudomonas sp. PA27(2017)]OLU30561.1 2-pyrone-4,6-dicarboxylate hydrolase [Pseudomonas sp. PA27(2017)]
MQFSRRRFLQAGGALGATLAFNALASKPSNNAELRPRFTPPAGSVDCHMHLYDSRYPTSPTATLFPPDASLEQYRAVQKRLGIRRMVIVTPSTYGTDNRLMLDGLLRSHGDARGVAVIENSIDDDALASLHEAGVRGIRFNLSTGGVGLDDLETLAARVNELGWNVQFAAGNLLAELENRLAKLPAKVVIDHLGHVPQPEGIHSDAFAALSRLVDNGKVWVKLSAPYVRSKVGGPGYEDAGKVATALIGRNPERMLWGSDWPHPTLAEDQKPDDARVLDLLADWAPDEKALSLILRDNPVSLYGF